MTEASKTTFKRRRMEFVLRADQPIKHLEGSEGNAGILARKKVRQPNGRFERVPYVSANAMRNRMRQAAAYALLDAAGLLGDKLSEAAVRLLFSGGMVTGKGDASVVKLDDYRRMTDIVPTLSLFGGCAGNRIIPGRLRVEDATLMCYETATQLPAWTVEWMRKTGTELATAREHVENAQRVRMDTMLDPGKRRLLLPAESDRVESRLAASEAAAADSDHAAIEREKSTMMPYEFERVCEGSLFRWSVEAECYSDLDEDTFLVAVAALLGNCRVAGGSGNGHGLLRAVSASDVKLARPAQDVESIDTTALASAVGSLFRAHVAERAEDLRTFLAGVEA